MAENGGEMGGEGSVCRCEHDPIAMPVAEWTANAIMRALVKRPKHILLINSHHRE